MDRVPVKSAVPAVQIGKWGSERTVMVGLSLFLQFVLACVLVLLALLSAQLCTLALIRYFKRPRSISLPELEEAELPRVLVQLPVRDEGALAIRVAAAAARLDWPRNRLQIHGIPVPRAERVFLAERPRLARSCRFDRAPDVRGSGLLDRKGVQTRNRVALKLVPDRLNLRVKRQGGPPTPIGDSPLSQSTTEPNANQRAIRPRMSWWQCGGSDDRSFVGPPITRVNRSPSHRIASLRVACVTYWVEYSEYDGSYVLHDAYSHRMEVC